MATRSTMMLMRWLLLLLCFTLPKCISAFQPLNHKKAASKAWRKSSEPSNRLLSSFRLTHNALPPTIGGETTRAVAALTVSSLTGFQMDRIVPESGILVSLVLSAFLSNTGLAPTAHPSYDLCWSFLPASLALLLLSMRQNKAPFTTINGEESVSKAIRRMSIPFCLASIGSLLGCIFSFGLCRQFPHLLPPNEALTAVSCLVASFVGGSVNFFATAALVADKSSTTLSSMAAADLVVMAIYFALLSAALQSRHLKSLFEEVNDKKVDPMFDSLVPETPSESLNVHNPFRMARATLLVSLLALTIVRTASHTETFLETIVPGTACAVIAAAVPLFNRWMPPSSTLWHDMQTMASPLSKFSFLLLFSSIGMSADLKAALLSGPACLLISLTALVIHMGVTLIGSWIVRRCWYNTIRLEDVLVASNAAIGGPATAAAFCGRIPGRRQKGLTLAATTWGVVGYAIGTTIGVSLYRFLQITL